MEDWLERGMGAAGTELAFQDKVWSQHSDDKIDIADHAFGVIKRVICRRGPDAKIRGLSIGCSYEPQFQMLQAACDGRLFLLDLRKIALDILKRRIKRQRIGNVSLIEYDYELLKDAARTRDFLRSELGGEPVDLIFLHHSLYYTPMDEWMPIVRNLYEILLAPVGAIDCALMAKDSSDPRSSTWLYNHFAGKFCSHVNDQDLRVLGDQLAREPWFDGALAAKRSKVSFWVDDFHAFMAVLWMILLYPARHQYSEAQRAEIVKHVHDQFFRPRQPLVQEQDHLAIYKGVALG